MPTTRHQYHFEDLSPDDFERLIYWLTKRSDEFDQVQWYGGARDKGRDVVAYKHTTDKREKWYIQCKRYQSITFTTLREELDKIAKHAEKEPDFSPDVIVFATACFVPPQAKDQAQDYSRTLGQPEPYYWGRLELDERLKAQPETEEEFFGEYVGLKAETIEEVLETLGTKTQAAIDISGSREELIGILELRARHVEEWIRRGMHASGGFRRKIGKGSFKQTINQFRSLHQAHIEALREGQLVYAHEVLLNIHKLLHDYDYEGPYAMPRDFTYDYPGPHKATKGIADLYDLLEDDLLDPIAKGEILILLVGFGENDFSGLKMGNIWLRDASLTECDFSNSDLTGAVLQKVSLRSVDLSGASLMRALLSNVELIAYLRDTDLRGATFHEMDLNQVTLTNARIDGLRLVDVTNIPSWLQRGLNDDRQFIVDLLVSAIQLGYRDFAGANLSGANFDNTSIVDVDFEKANLTRVSMRSATLSGINLMHADLTEADLRGSRISNSKFNGAEMKFVVWSGAFVEASSLFSIDIEESDIRRSSFNEVDLRSTTLTGSNLANTTFRKVDLKHASLKSTNLANVDLSGINLGGVELDGAKIQGAVGVPKWVSIALDERGFFSRDLLLKAIRTGLRDLAGANLSRADLKEIDLSGAELQNTDLVYAFLSEANLTNADLSHADLSHSSLEGANLTNANLSHANLVGSSLEGTNLTNANLSHANLGGSSLEGANLTNANLSHANLSGSSLAGVDFSGANLTDADFGYYSRAKDIPDGVRLDENGIFVSMEE